MESFRCYEHHYIDQDGVDRIGHTMHHCDSEAISYYQSMEVSRGIKVLKLKDPNGCPIWTQMCCYGRTCLPR